MFVGWNPAPFDGWMVISVVAMLLASLSYGLATVYAKRSLHGVSSFGAAVLLFPGCVATVAVGASDTSPSIRAALALVALGLVCTSLAYLLYFHLIGSAGVVKTSSGTFLIPIFGILWSALFLNEAVHPSMLIGFGPVTGIRVSQLLPSVFRAKAVAGAAGEC